MTDVQSTLTEMCDMIDYLNGHSQRQDGTKLGKRYFLSEDKQDMVNNAHAELDRRLNDLTAVAVLTPM